MLGFSGEDMKPRILQCSVIKCFGAQLHNHWWQIYDEKCPIFFLNGTTEVK